MGCLKFKSTIAGLLILGSCQAARAEAPAKDATSSGTTSDDGSSFAPEAPVRPIGFSGPGAPPGDFLPVPDRWRIGLPAGYGQNRTGSLLNPYTQNFLKGDYAIPGTQDLFMSLSLTSDTLFEARRLPVPSGVSTARPDRFAFFGSGRQAIASENIILSLSLFQGDASYKPRDFEVRITPVFNGNFVHASELNIARPSPEHSQDRTDAWVGFQELFVEKKLTDLSSNYDFVSVRAGIQGFTSDFRGFLFSDNEPGVRIFGNYDNNRLQFNLAWFAQVEKDTNSGLNTFALRDQNVFLANVYRQDFIWPGYTAELSFHTNLDSSHGYHYDTNGVITRPAAVGTVHDKEVRAYYLGWAGDGHIGPLNLSHQFYQALGTESFNEIAGRKTNINAQFGAIELSLDRDWLRYRASFVYASGDSKSTDGTATGFDSIFDNPNFAGGGTNFFTRQAIRLTGSGVNLVNRNSFLPDLRTSKEQGQANFVNPGLFLYNLGVDADITPKLKAIANVSYLQFANTNSVRLLLQDNKIPRDIGIDYSLGLQYRPFLNNNAILEFGAAALTPGSGFKAIYTSSTLYSVFFGVTLTY